MGQSEIEEEACFIFKTNKEMERLEIGGRGWGGPYNSLASCTAVDFPTPEIHFSVSETIKNNW